jgi:hypothetical protein
MFAYALTIFTGAFLLFQVQPLIGKYILPWFGGSPGVWTTCMLFFQTAARRIRVCPFLHQVAEAEIPGGTAPRAACPGAGAAPDHAGRQLETAGGRRSDVAYPGAAHRQLGAALFCALGHRAIDAAVVQPDQSRPLALPALRPVERRLVAGLAQLSVFFRASPLAPCPGQPMVGRPRPLRAGLRLLRLAATPARRSGCASRCRRRRGN